MNKYLLILITVFFLNQAIANDTRPLELEVYVTAHQVDQLLSTPEDREKAFHIFQDIGITKVYLETLRSGHIPKEHNLIQTRDFFRENGVEVSAGVTTTAGPEFGTCSNQSRHWLNYQTEKTQRDISKHFRWMSSLFDEIMVDDFLATNDKSGVSQKAKGNRTWSEYRLDLMSNFAKKYMIAPAREENPNVQLIIKYPQWYDRFHRFGYDVVREPKMFDRVWVGTETRNPETKRFGFVRPTQGYINFSWIHSIAPDKTFGAWFDFGDCTPQSYLMQAYQSVLAGAQELVLFEAGSVLKKNPCIEPFLQRPDALYALETILQDKKSIGIPAYKPPHSDGSDPAGGANLYIYDYIASLGLSPVPVATPPEKPSCIFLPRQAADDPQIKKHIRKWISGKTTILTTPDFMSAIGDLAFHPNAGFGDSLTLTNTETEVNQVKVDEKIIHTGLPVKLRPIEVPPKSQILCAGISEKERLPILIKHKLESGAKLLFLNICTFKHEEFGPGKEEFLPPRPLTIKNWPAEVVNRIRQEIPYPYSMNIKNPNNVGVYYYDKNILILANFNDTVANVKITALEKNSAHMHLHPDFPHLPETNLKNQEHSCVVSVPSWELAVIQWN